MKMRLKKPGLAIAVVGALAAVMASTALGAMKTEEVEWYTGTTATNVTTLTGDKAVTLKKGLHAYEETGTANEVARFKVTTGAATYELTATGIECVSCNITNGTTNAEKGMVQGKIKFTGVTVMSPEPANCSVQGGVVLTNELLAHADWMEEGVAEKAFVKFEPRAGATGAFATLEVTGPECANAANLVVKGVVFCEAINKTTVMAKEQACTFSKRIHETTGSTFNVSGKTAFLEARFIAEVGGLFFGVK